MALVRITITLPQALVAAADRRAKQLDRSRSWVLAVALRAWLGSESRAVREPAPEYGAPLDAARDVAEARRRHLITDLALSPAERLRRAEELGRLAVEARRRAGRRGEGRRLQIIGFDSYEDFYEWKKARLVGG